MTRGKQSERKMQSILMVNFDKDRPDSAGVHPRLSAGAEPDASLPNMESEEGLITDFGHLPKWRRPSVRIPASRLPYAEETNNVSSWP
jgi:hypothetical protein